MQFASHSTSVSLSRLNASGLSAVFAPVQALMAFFMPPQAPPVCRAVVVQRPIQRVSSLQIARKPAANATSTAACVRPVSRLKVMREFEPGMGRSQAGRMAISGSMADVCAELDRIATTR